ncbi:MAG: hypothetical protein JWN74_3285 [Acidobacteriaceae bacterium]|nr:hypothetical protein [Acidobacteriaceae bacterium]
MRRFAAHLALAAIYASFFAPLVVAAQESSLHACCMHAGAHHCQAPSNEAGFHSKAHTCPYSGPLSPRAAFGLEPAKFRIALLEVAGVVTYKRSSSYSLLALRNLSARAPPISLL